MFLILPLSSVLGFRSSFIIDDKGDREANKSRDGNEHTISSLLSSDITLFSRGLVDGAPSVPLTEAVPNNVAKSDNVFSLDVDKSQDILYYKK
mmetsp:Transcript_47430/g.92561  ORF Transcript_47430/g.92561 Transcript_47430/m.92561 type:complete len:93 (-) Transcript_47430:207-485(-)